MTQSRINTLVRDALDEIYQQLPPEDRSDPSEVVLFGQGGELESLVLVNYIILVEDKLEAEFQRRIDMVALFEQLQQSDRSMTVDGFAEVVSAAMAGQA